MFKKMLLANVLALAAPAAFAQSYTVPLTAAEKTALGKDIEHLAYSTYGRAMGEGKTADQASWVAVTAVTDNINAGYQGCLERKVAAPSRCLEIRQTALLAMKNWIITRR
jgi:hypothetical protein